MQMTARLQIELAKRLVRSGMPMGEVALQCGYSHQAHFSARFKDATGLAPTRWLASTAG